MAVDIFYAYLNHFKMGMMQAHHFHEQLKIVMYHQKQLRIYIKMKWKNNSIKIFNKVNVTRKVT